MQLVYATTFATVALLFTATTTRASARLVCTGTTGLTWDTATGAGICLIRITTTGSCWVGIGAVYLHSVALIGDSKLTIEITECNIIASRLIFGYYKINSLSSTSGNS